METAIEQEGGLTTPIGGWAGFQRFLCETLGNDPFATDVIVTPGLPLHIVRMGAVAATNAACIVTYEDVKDIVRGVETVAPHLREQLHMVGDADAVFVCRQWRFRVHVFRQMGGVCLVFRKVRSHAPTRHSLNLPPQIHRLSVERDGLILFAGAAGQGKTTTMAAVIQEINEQRACHITTVEDPIEYVFHNARSVVHQRCVGIDVVSFAAGVRAAVRQSAQVIVIGEIRDGETAAAALQAAETGHLVVGTIHGADVPAAIERFLGLLDNQQPARSRVAHIFRWVVAQRLVPRIKDAGGDRMPVLEILGRNERSAAYIRDGESSGLRDVMRADAANGMGTFDDNLYRAFQRGLITAETAAAYASNPSDMRHRLLWGEKDEQLTTI